MTWPLTRPLRRDNSERQKFLIVKKIWAFFEVVMVSVLFGGWKVAKRDAVTDTA